LATRAQPPLAHLNDNTHTPTQDVMASMADASVHAAFKNQKLRAHLARLEAESTHLTQHVTDLELGVMEEMANGISVDYNFLYGGDVMRDYLVAGMEGTEGAEGTPDRLHQAEEVHLHAITQVLHRQMARASAGSSLCSEAEEGAGDCSSSSASSSCSEDGEESESEPEEEEKEEEEDATLRATGYLDVTTGRLTAADILALERGRLARDARLPHVVGHGPKVVLGPGRMLEVPGCMKYAV
jgi:hypothetical protein